MLTASTTFALLQEIPVTVANEQLSEALQAQVEGQGGAPASTGPSASVLLLFFVMLSLLVAMAWIARRNRTASPAAMAVASDAAPPGAGQGGPTPAEAPQETLALPPHVLAVLARQAKERGRGSVPADSGERARDQPLRGKRPAGQHAGGPSGLDILLGR